MSHQVFCTCRNHRCLSASYRCLRHGRDSFSTRSQHLSWGCGSRARHAAFWLVASTHAAAVGRATTSSDSMRCFQLGWPKAGGEDRNRRRWSDILELWRCAGQSRGIPYPILDSQHTGSLPRPDDRKHLHRFKQVKQVQNYTVEKLAID